MALRLSNKDKETLRSLNRKAKNKYKRLYTTYGFTQKRLRKDYSKYGISANFKIKDIKEFTTRQELNIYKKDIERFLGRGVFAFIRGGVNKISYERKQMYVYYPIPRDVAWKIRREFKKANERAFKRSLEANKITFDTRGQKTAMSTLDRVYSIQQKRNTLKFRYSEFKPVKFEPKNITSRGQLNRLLYGVEKYRTKKSQLERIHTMKENYIKALENTFGENADGIIALINDLSDEDFLLYYHSEDFSDFSYIYDPMLALEVINYLTEHMIHFIKEREIKIRNYDLFQATELMNNLTSEDILNEYGKGSLGGLRKTLYINGKRYIIDLTKEEEKLIDSGIVNIEELPDFNERIKRQRVYSEK